MRLKLKHLAFAWIVFFIVVAGQLTGCAAPPQIELNDFDINQGLKFGPGKSLEDPDAGVMSVGYRALAGKSEGHRAGLDCNATWFREQVRKETTISDYWHLMCRYTWEWDLFWLGGAPVYAFIGTGGGYVSDSIPLFGGCQGAFSQRAGVGWGLFIPYYGHESTFGFCDPNSGQDYWGLELTGAIRWVIENVF